jgi:Skp family chaperone for outer membrane proteins
MKRDLMKIGAAVVATAVLTFAISGFQANGSKMAVVDMQRILGESKAGKKIQDDMNIQINLRQGLLEFVNTNKIVTDEQAAKLKDLTLKANATQADKDELERIKTAVRAESKKFNDLMVKQTLTDAERTQFQTLNDRRRASDALLSKWNDEFSQDLSTMRDDMLSNVLKKARDAVQDVGKKEGYTLIFPTTVAVYAANDITDAAIKAVDGS